MAQAPGENPGCLGVLFSLLGLEPRETAELPYRLRDDFLSPAEMMFYRVLCLAAAGRAVVCPKVNLADIFFVARPHENQAYRNRIDRKHLDFLLCDPVTMRPVLGIELDDSSHTRASRSERDRFVDAVFRRAGLPLTRVWVQPSYDVADLARWLSQYLGPPGPAAALGLPPTPAAAATAAAAAAAAAMPASALSRAQRPLCPKCGVPMVLRVASRGDRQGEQFYGCPNYPRCREVIPLTRRP